MYVAFFIFFGSLVALNIGYHSHYAFFFFTIVGNIIHDFNYIHVCRLFPLFL